MYSVFGDGICIYNDLNLSGNINALTPKLDLADNTAGTFEITLPVGNAGYETLERLSSEIIVKRYNEEIWAGRIISEQKNFQNSRILTCEGELAYFNDTTQPPNEYVDVQIYDFIDAILEEHNSKVSENKQFEMGSITVHGTVSGVTNNETTMEAMSGHLVDKFGGHIRIRRVYDENGTLHKYLDYLEDYPNTNAQTIRFGENMLDFTLDLDMSEYATVIMPRGSKLDSSPIESVDAYLDVSSVNGGSRYVTNEEAIKKYGWIEMVVDWEDVTEASELLQKAKNYLADKQFDDMVIEVSAVDLRYLSKDVQPINLLDNVRCISKPHGMSRVFPVTELSIQLDSPENSTYTLGSKSKESTLTASTRAANTEILDRIAKIPNEKTILDKAKDNASSIINMATQGYVTIIKNQNGSEYLAVSSENANVAYDPETDEWSEDTKLWIWNVNGLGYSKNGGRKYDTAITMDGAIVADYITTGSMSANRIRTGILKDEKGNTSWNLNTGVLTMKKGSISLGMSSSFPDGRFSVDDDGYLTAEYGNIGGFTISSDSIFNDVISLKTDGIYFYDSKSGDLFGRYAINKWVIKSEDGDLINQSQGLTISTECIIDETTKKDMGYIMFGHRDKASDDYITMKLMYTPTDLSAGDGSVFRGDRLHLGTNFQLDHYCFEYSYGREKYCSFTKTHNNASKEPMMVDLAYNFHRSGALYTCDTINCYICNGILMIRDGSYGNAN